MADLTKILYFILIVDCMAARAFGQSYIIDLSDHDKYVLSASLGPSFPVGDFAYPGATNPDLSFAGAPKTGICGKADFSYFINSDAFGITLSFLSFWNKSGPTDEGKYLRLPTGGLGGGKFYSSYTWDAGSWSFNYLSAGPIVELFGQHQVTWRIRLTAGLLVIGTPKVTMETQGSFWQIGSNGEPFTETFKQPVQLSANFAMSAGTDVTLKLKKGFGLILSVDLLGSDAWINGKITNELSVNASSYSGESTYSIHEKIFLLTGNVGVMYTLE
jgi:hypothetical protein